MNFYLAVGRNGSDDLCWIAWREGRHFRAYVPSEELWNNYAGVYELPDISGTDEDVLAAGMNSLYEKRAPFKIIRRQLPPGAYYPRIRRGELVGQKIDHELTTLTLDDMDLRPALVSSASAAMILFNKMKAMFDIIEPAAKHGFVYGHELRHLLIMACTEVETAWRSILSANCYPMSKPLRTTDYVKLLKPMQLNEWKVRLLRSNSDNWILAPFETWSSANPTTSLTWYDAYNAAKHDRENHLQRANLDSVINAMGALYIMLISQFSVPEVHATGINHFVVEEAPEIATIDAYIHNFRLDCDTVPRWKPFPMFS